MPTAEPIPASVQSRSSVPSTPRIPFRPTPGERSELDRLLTGGLLRRVIGDVLVAADVVDDLALRVAAVRLLIPAAWARARAPLALWTAAWLHAGGAPPAVLHLVVPAGYGSRLQPGIRLHEGLLVPGHLTEVAGLPVTTPARTAADLARAEPQPEALHLLAQLRAATGVGPSDALRVLVDLPRCRGLPRARVTLQAWAAAVTSEPRHSPKPGP